MELADLVLIPSNFVEGTIRTFYPNKKVALAPYGVDLNFWKPAVKKSQNGLLRYIYAGQLSLGKGIPMLIEAWNRAAVRDAQLQIVGTWNLAADKLAALPHGVTWIPQCSQDALRERFWAADVFVLPSFFDGFGLVLLEAMACGLPAIASESTAGPDFLNSTCGRVFPTGHLDALVEDLKWFDRNRTQLPEMSRAARGQAERCTWENYRRSVTEAVAPFV